jgi:hypothetical protein
MHFYRFAIDVISFISAFLLFIVISPVVLGAQASWKNDWEKTVRAAEAEGRLTLHGCCYEYDRILEGFRKKYQKIRSAAAEIAWTAIFSRGEF